MEPYELLFHEQALTTLRPSRGENRRSLSRFFEDLESDPFVDPERTFEVRNGRLVSRVRVRSYLVDFIVDHPVKEVKVVGLLPLR